MKNVLRLAGEMVVGIIYIVSMATFIGLLGIAFS